MKKSIFTVICIILLLSVLLPGCSAPNAAASGAPAASAAALKITGLPEGDITVDMSAAEALKTYEGKVESTDSAGYPVVYDIKGGYFSDLLEKNGYSQPGLAGIRLIASDGYSIQVPPEVLKTRDIIIAYEIDGKPLDEKNAPFRVFIPGERAMYWARMVTEINVLSAVDSGAVSGVYIMESLYTPADYQDYEFAGQSFKVLDTNKIISAHPGSKGNAVLMTAADGLVKNETLENFFKGVINMTGADSPEFLSGKLPAGMFVKRLAMFKYGGNAFYFAALKKAQTLDALAEFSGLTDAGGYTLNFADGTSQKVLSSGLSEWALEFKDGKVFVQEQGDDNQYNLVSINID